ncbi:MAG: GDP-L-fucose synthase [Gemmatimonadaceae bacterium]
MRGVSDEAGGTGIHDAGRIVTAIPLPAETFTIAGKRLWVTGGHGFLGQHLVRELERRGAKVIATRSSDVDLLDPGAARRCLEAVRPDGVLHLAARVGGIGENSRHPGDFFYANMVMGLHLIEACRLEGVEKLMVLGTVCAYPKFCPTPFREEDLWNGYPEETNAPYGIAKKALLVQLQAYRQQYGTRAIFLIPVNLYGPGDHLDLASNHVTPALIRKFLEAKRDGGDHVELWGTGNASREFLYVEDAARGIAEAMMKYEGGDPVNLGTGQEVTIRELALKIKALIGFTGEIRFNSAYPDGQPKRRLDTRRATERFGWTAQVDLDEGLRRTVTWMRGILER